MNKIELFLILTLVFFYSCNNDQVSTTRYTGPKVIESRGYIVPKDSTTEQTVILVDEKKLQKIAVGKPNVVSISTNIHSAGKPKSVEAGKPRVCTPGQDTFLLPPIVQVVDSPFMAGKPEVVIANDAYYKDQSMYNFGSFTKQHGLKHTWTRGLIEDREGNLWFGMSSNGVSKYDGKRFTFYGENQGLLSNNISTKKEGNKILISVKDNGNGIPQKILDKIFQPFFTTKPTGQGTGLGLSLAYDIVTKGHGGSLEVLSTVRRERVGAESDKVPGSEFIIILSF